MFSLPDDFAPARAAIAGAVASAAYAAEMYADMAVTGSPLDDVQLLEGMARGKRARIPALGMALHLANGAVLGGVYAVAERYLPGPAWLRGATFGTLFLLAAWPATLLVDKYHPLIKRGELPTFNRPVAFAQNVARHLVFGVALGIVYQALKQSSRR